MYQKGKIIPSLKNEILNFVPFHFWHVVSPSYTFGVGSRSSGFLDLILFVGKETQAMDIICLSSSITGWLHSWL